jgi:hypothetical protein
MDPNERITILIRNVYARGTEMKNLELKVSLGASISEVKQQIYKMLLSDSS